MSKKMHKILLTITVSTMLMLNSFCIAEINAPDDNTIYNPNANSMELIQNDVKVKDIDIDPLDTQKVKKEVVPDTKQESKKLIGLFLKAMVGVAFCSVVIYALLLLMNKKYGTTLSAKDIENFDVPELKTPNNKIDAFRSFLDRSK